MNPYRRLTPTRHIPPNAVAVTEDASLGVCYVYPIMACNSWGVIAYVGKSNKATFHYSYKRESDMDRRIADFFAGLRAHREYVAKSRQERYAGHTLKPGDVIYNSWGYEQTNVDWYVVTRASKAYVWLRPIASTMETSESVGPMSGQCAPALDADCRVIVSEKGKETKHAANGQSVRFKHGAGSKYAGGTVYESWYA